MIPHALTLLARPLLLPEAEVRQRAFGSSAVERWRALYDIDFTPLLEAAIPGPTHTITEGEVVATWPPVGPPVELDHGGSHHLRRAISACVDRPRR